MSAKVITTSQGNDDGFSEGPKLLPIVSVKAVALEVRLQVFTLVTRSESSDTFQRLIF